MGRMLFLAILVGVGLLASSSYPTPTLSSAEAVTKQESPCQQLNLTDTGLEYLNQGDQVTLAPQWHNQDCWLSILARRQQVIKVYLRSETGVAPGITCNSLIGSIGEGTPFEVGTSLSFSVETAGGSMMMFASFWRQLWKLDGGGGDH